MSRLAIAIWIGILLLAPYVFAQDSSATFSGTARPTASVMDVCDLKHLPPCATAPRPIRTPDAHYSNQARKKKINGVVLLVVIIGKDGLPQDIHVTRGLGYGLDEEAIKAVRKWKFTPATFDGVPVPVRINVETNFRTY